MGRIEEIAALLFFFFLPLGGCFDFQFKDHDENLFSRGVSRGVMITGLCVFILLIPILFYFLISFALFVLLHRVSKRVPSW